MTGRAGLLAMVALSLAGCVDRAAWDAPPNAALSFDQQAARCGDAAGRADNLVGGFLLGGMIGYGIVRQTNLDDCMKANGWRAIR